MSQIPRNRHLLSRDAAETLGAEALAFLAEEPVRLGAFFAASGLQPSDVRANAGSPELLSAVLDYLSRDESLLLVFAASRQVAAESIGQAIARLQAPEA